MASQVGFVYTAVCHFFSEEKHVHWDFHASFESWVVVVGRKTGPRGRFVFAWALRQQYYGPFEIIERKTAATFELKLPAASNVHPIFHVDVRR